MATFIFSLIIVGCLGLVWGYAIGRRDGRKSGLAEAARSYNNYRGTPQLVASIPPAMGLSILSVPIQKRGDRGAIGDQSDFLSWQEGEPNSLVRPASKEDIAAIRTDHFKTHVLGLRGIIGKCEDREILWKLNNAYYCDDPFQHMRPIRPYIGHGCADEPKDDPFTELMLGVMGLRPSDVEIYAGIEREKEIQAEQAAAHRKLNPGSLHYKIEHSDDDYKRWFLREWMQKAFNDKPHELRVKWANTAIDKIFEMKMKEQPC